MVVNILRFLFIIGLTEVSFQISISILEKFNKKLEEAMGKEIIRFKKLRNIKIPENEIYQSYFKKVDVRLISLGRPWGITLVKYYLFKIPVSILAFVLTILSNHGFAITVIVSIAAYFAIDIFMYLNNRDEEKVIKNDLPDIYDILDIQTSANVDLGAALTELSDIPISPRLKKNLAELAASIYINKNPPKALDEFRRNYRMIEIDSFVLCIKQSLITGKLREILGSQSDALKDSNLYTIQEETRGIDNKVFWVMGVLVAGLIAMIFFSFGNQILSSITKIFN